jgi:hypothetical protein
LYVSRYLIINNFSINFAWMTYRIAVRAVVWIGVCCEVYYDGVSGSGGCVIAVVGDNLQ